MNKTRTYYQPEFRYVNGMPGELMSFHAFATKDDCEAWLENNCYDSGAFIIREYHDDDIEGVTILDESGNIIETNEEDETADRYFSEDLYAVLNGTMTASEFRRLWGELEYDAMNGIINVGNNTIITNED